MPKSKSYGLINRFLDAILTIFNSMTNLGFGLLCLAFSLSFMVASQIASGFLSFAFNIFSRCFSSVFDTHEDTLLNVCLD